MNGLKYLEQVEELRRLSNVLYRKNFAEYQSLLKIQGLMEEHREELERVDYETLTGLIIKADAQIAIKKEDLEALAEINDFFENHINILKGRQ